MHGNARRHFCSCFFFFFDYSGCRPKVCRYLVFFFCAVRVCVLYTCQVIIFSTHVLRSCCWIGPNNEITMADSVDTKNVTKFDGQNFQLWKFQMRAIFIANDLLDIVSGIKTKPKAEGQEQGHKRTPRQ